MDKTRAEQQSQPSGAHDGVAAAGQHADAAADLLAQLAHELRTPLGAVLSLAELLRDERFGPLGSPRYQSYAADIYRSAHHALAVVNAMLDRDSLRTGRPVFEVADVDLAAIAADCIAIAGPSAHSAGVDIGLEVAPALPAVPADARSLRQMLLNLLANAIRHSPSGGRVRVSVGRRADGAVVLAVEDHGEGMSEAEVARAMSAAASADRRQAGGIGIPLVRALAVANGAELTLASRPGEGTCAAIVLGRGE